MKVCHVLPNSLDPYSLATAHMIVSIFLVKNDQRNIVVSFGFEDLPSMAWHEVGSNLWMIHTLSF